jgi:hypothetical protein
LNLAGILVQAKIIELPPGFSIPGVNRPPKFSNVAAALMCAFAAPAWAWIGIRIFDDTLVGAALIAIPSVVLAIAAGVIFFRSFF